VNKNLDKNLNNFGLMPQFSKCEKKFAKNQYIGVMSQFSKCGKIFLKKLKKLGLLPPFSKCNKIKKWEVMPKFSNVHKTI
jgi:hypothetical protein